MKHSIEKAKYGEQKAPLTVTYVNSNQYLRTQLSAKYNKERKKTWKNLKN